jgi:hypothetical protein
MDPQRSAAAETIKPAGQTASAAPSPQVPLSAMEKPPLLPPEVSPFYAPVRNNPPQGSMLLFHPMVLGAATTYFVDAKAGVATQQTTICFAEFPEEGFDVNWNEAITADVQLSDLEKTPGEEGSYENFPGTAAKSKNYDKWSKSFLDSLFRNQRLQLWKILQN